VRESQRKERVSGRERLSESLEKGCAPSTHLCKESPVCGGVGVVRGGTLRERVGETELRDRVRERVS
jgi:hypothetical protein